MNEEIKSVDKRIYLSTILDKLCELRAILIFRHRYFQGGEIFDKLTKIDKENDMMIDLIIDLITAIHHEDFEKCIPRLEVEK